MKNSAKNIEVHLFLIFIVITIPLVYSLYNLQDNLAEDLGLDPNMVKDYTSITILKLIGFFVTEVFIGGIGVFLIIKESRRSDLSDLNNYLDESVYTKEENKEKEITVKETFDTKPLLDQIKELSTKSDLKEYCNQTISIISKTLEVSQGVFFITKNNNKTKYLQLIAGYAYYRPDNGETQFAFGEGLAGQVAKAKKIINITDVPEGYIKIMSGLGEATPGNLLIIPLVDKNQTIALMELASFKNFSSEQEEVISKASQLITTGIIERLKEKKSEPAK